MTAKKEGLSTMRKKHMFSLAAITAALCVPISPVLAISPLAPEQIPEHLNADQFVNLFGGTFEESSQSGYVIRQFAWFRQATLDNAALILQGREIFDTLDEATRQAIYAKYQAQQINYDELVQQAEALLSPVDAAITAPEVSKEDRPIVQNVPKEEEAVQAPATQPVAPADGTAASQPVNEPTQGAQQPEPEQPAKPVDGSGSADAANDEPVNAPGQNVPAASASQTSSDTPDQPSNPVDKPADESHAVDLIYIQTLKPTEKEQTVLSAFYALQTRPVAEAEDDLATIRPVSEVDSELAITKPVSEDASDLAHVDPVSEEESDSSSLDDQVKEDPSKTDENTDQQPDQKPNPEDKPVQTINPGMPTIVNNPQPEADPDVVFLVEDRPDGLSFVDDLTPFDANTEKLIQALASKAGFTIFEAHPVTYTFEKDGLKAVSQGLIKVSENCKPVLFQIQAITDHDADVIFLSDESCDIDAAGVLNLKKTGSMHIDFDQDQPAASGDADEKSEPEVNQDDLEDQAKPADPDEQLVEKGQTEAGQPVINPQSDLAKPEVQTVVQTQPEPEAQEETAILAKLNPAENNLAQTLADPAVLPDFAGESTSTSKDASANDFINKYCLYNGSVIKTVDSSNYHILLNGASAWNALSNVSRTTVNSYLTNAGSTRWQLLYQQANRVRLGLAGGRTPSKTPATAVKTSALWYLAIAGISGEVMIYCANMARKSKSKKSA